MDIYKESINLAENLNKYGHQVISQEILSASDLCDVAGGAASLVSVAGDCRYDIDHRTVGAGVRPTSAGVSFRAL